MRSKDQLILGKEHKRLMKGCAEKSLDATFGPEPEKRYPFCMRQKRMNRQCRICGRKRRPQMEMMAGLCRNCYQLHRVYEGEELTRLARAKIKLGKFIRERTH